MLTLLSGKKKTRQTNGEYRSQQKNGSRKVIVDNEKSILNEVKSNTKAFFRYVRSKLNFKNTILFLVDNSKTMSDENGKAKTSHTFFISVFTKKSYCLLHFELYVKNIY